MDVFDAVALEHSGYLRDVALRAAMDLRLADALPATAAVAAERLKLASPRRLRRLLDVLVLFGLARRDGETFHAALTGTPGPIPSGGWGNLAEVIRTDRPLALPTQGEELKRFHDHLFETGLAPAWEIWADPANVKAPLLDLGGGSGAYAAVFPGESTIADTPEVLALSRAPLAKTLALDLLNSSYPGGQGTVLLANIVHLFGERDNLTIMRKAAGALEKGGHLIVKDLLVDRERTGPAESILFALNMAVFTAEGDVYDEETITRWLAAAGLLPPRRTSLKSSPGSLVLVASKP